MDKQLQALHGHLEAAVQRTDANGIEFWFARDLQPLLGYTRWENFQAAIKRAMESREASGYAASGHFRGVTKMVQHVLAWRVSKHRANRGDAPSNLKHVGGCDLVILIAADNGGV